MKILFLTALCGGIGFLAGIAIPRDRAEPEASAPLRRSARLQAVWTPSSHPPGQRLLPFANHAASLTPENWPAFFKTRMHDPGGTRLAERLWAEQDPVGYWKWLTDQRDGHLLRQYGRNLLHSWAIRDPDAAMRAANSITDKKSSDDLRSEVIDTVLAANLAKGLELAANAADFNRFSRGSREWMKNNPSAAVQGLAKLPERSEYRGFLSSAVVEWAAQDAPALLAWLKTHPVGERDDWFGEAFKSAAMKDSRDALEAATGLDDAIARDAAIAGVLASGTITTAEMTGLLDRLSLQKRADATISALDALPMKNVAQLEEVSRLLDDAPACRNMLNRVGSMAEKWIAVDWNRGLAWAAALPDSSMRRKALATIASKANREQLDAFATTVARAPMLDLSDELFRTVLRSLPAGEAEAWVARLPPDRAAWAKAVAEPNGE